MVKLHLLGPTELTGSDGQEISGVLTRRKGLALLSYLALQEPWSFCRRETLAGLLWPDSSESRARASLSVALHHLRGVLGRRVLLGRGSEEIGVDPDALWVDVRAFLEAVDGGDIREAGELYRGDLLDGFHVSGASAFTTWLEGERRRLRLLVVDSLTGQADSMVQTDPAEACTWARRATTLAPHDQKAHASLIRALARSSHQAEALRVLGELEDRLRTDLDLEPCAEIRALERRLRSVDDGLQSQPGIITIDTDPGGSRGHGGSGDGGEAAKPGDHGSGPGVDPRVDAGAVADDSLEGSVRRNDVGSRPADEASSVVFRKGVAVGAAAAIALAFAVWALAVNLAGTVTPAVERYELTFRDGQAPTPRTGSDPVGNLTLALSPDGSRLVYVRREDDGTRRLWLRSRAEESASPLAGTDGVRTPFFSPDGGAIGLLTSRPAFSLRVIPAEGGPPLTLVASNVQDDFGASWGPDGYIYYIDMSMGLLRVPETGGASEVVREPDRSDAFLSLGFPEALPNGRGVLITLMRGLGNEGIASDSIGVLDLQSGEMRTLVRGLRATFLPPGFLIFTTVDGSIMAAEFDEDRLHVTGPEVPIVTGLGVQRRTRLVNLTLSPSGRLIYEISSDRTIEPIWVDRSGRVSPVEPGWTIEAARVSTVALSPGDRRIAISTSSPRGASELLINELGGGAPLLLPLGGPASWSQDGSRLLVVADTSGRSNYDVWSVAPDGIGTPNLLVDLDQPIAHAIWEAHDETLLVRTSFQPSATVLRVDSDGQVDSLLASDSISYTTPVLSPDGRYLAHLSNEMGRPEIYVRSYPAMDRRWTISSGGGREPVWAHDGRRVYFKSLPDEDRSVPAQLWSVTFDPTEDLPVGARTALFPLPEGVSSDGFFAGFDVTEDDERFLMYRASSADDGGSGTTYHVVNEFLEEVRSRTNR